MGRSVATSCRLKYVEIIPLAFGQIERSIQIRPSWNSELRSQNSELRTPRKGERMIGSMDQWVGSYRSGWILPENFQNFQNFQNFELRFVEDGCTLSIFFIRKSSVAVPTFSTVVPQYPFPKILLQSCIGSSLSVQLPLAPTQRWVCLRGL